MANDLEISQKQNSRRDVYNVKRREIVKSLFADKSAAWQAFILAYSQIQITLFLNETTVFAP